MESSGPSSLSANNLRTPHVDNPGRQLPVYAVQLTITLIAVVALLALVISTRLGPGIGGDATIYITSARNLLAGRGFGLVGPAGEFRLLPYFAPFFSLVLSGLGLTGVDLVQGARWLNMLLFAALVWLAGISTFRLTRSALAGLAAAGLLGASPILIPIYSWAMSEPLALFLGFAGLWLVLLALRNEKRGWAFYGSAALTGLSFFTRYSAVAFVIAACLGLLLFLPGRWTRRIPAVLRYGAIAVLPTLAWMGMNLLFTAAVSSRSVESGLGMLQRLSHFWPQFFDMLLVWLVPFSWIDAPRYPAIINQLMPLLLPLVVLGWLALVAFLELRKRGRAAWRDERLRWALLLFLLAVIYLAVILAVYVTTYPPITIDNRMLSPLHVAMIWLLALLASVTAGIWPARRWLSLLLTAGVTLAIVWFGWRSLLIVRVNAQKGLGYSSLEWRNSQTLKALQSIPANLPLVTNETTALLFLADRRAYPLMEIYQAAPSAVFSRYGEGDLDADEGQRLFREGKAPLVLFDTISGQMESLYGERTSARLQALTQGLRLLYQGDDGAIYTYGK